MVASYGVKLTQGNTARTQYAVAAEGFISDIYSESDLHEPFCKFCGQR